MISRDEAWALLLPHLAPLPVIGVPRRRARGRVLAGEMTATVDVPSADVSAMDGYALAGDREAGARLPVAGRVAAGERPGRVLPEGAALKIMTGAPVPAGADRVIPFERTDRGAETVEIVRPVDAGANVRRRGEVMEAGSPLLAAGAPLSAEALALLATHGVGEVTVHQTPRVAVLTTGDEVLPPEADPEPGQLRDSHTDFLLAACAALGVEAQALGIAPDEPRELGRRLAAGLDDADVLLVGGGVSAGELDYVEPALADLGCRALFTSVSIQPGKPLTVAVRAAGDDPRGRRRLVFGLPGNPGSVMVTYHLFVRPALRRLMGHAGAEPHDRLQQGVLVAPASASKKRDLYLPARVAAREGVLEVEPLASRGSHDLLAHARGNALLYVPAESGEGGVGEACRVLVLD